MNDLPVASAAKRINKIIALMIDRQLNITIPQSVATVAGGKIGPAEGARRARKSAEQFYQLPDAPFPVRCGKATPGITLATLCLVKKLPVA